MSVKNKNNALAVVDELPQKNLLEIVKEKTEFVRWVQKNIKSESMRKMALEHASHYYLNVRYDMELELLRSKIEKIYSYKLRLTELCHKHQINVLADYQKLKSAILEATKEKTKLLNVPDGTLLPPELQKERLQAMKEQEKRELHKLQVDQTKRRFFHKALSLDAAERARLRSEFIARMKQEIDDPELLEETITEYDRIINQSQFGDEE
jgi:hypothetical protein